MIFTINPHISWHLQKVYLIFLIGVSFLTAVLIIFNWYYSSRFLPRTYLNETLIGGKTLPDALETLSALSPTPDETTLTLVLGENTWSISSEALGLHSTHEAVLADHLEKIRNQSPAERLARIVLSPTRVQKLHSNYDYDPSALELFIETLDTDVLVESKPAQAKLLRSGGAVKIQVTNGTNGQELDQNTTRKELKALAGELARNSVTHQLPTTDKIETLSEPQVQDFKTTAQTLVGKTLVIGAANKNLTLSDVQLVELLAFPKNIQPKLAEQVITTWKELYEKPPQDAVFAFDEKTLEVTEFVPDEPGVEVHTPAALLALSQKIAEVSDQADTKSSLELPVTLTQPKHQLKETNSIGITEVVGFGESEYDHSIPSRIFNIAHTAKIINNTLVAPGEEFSFNTTLGEVSAQTGFKPAYVILKGQTVLGDGGGVCQVSTTLFRALLDGGLLVTKRLPHSYRVSYYELNAKPGLDATVYSGDVDLRFINDTGHHILIHTSADSTKLTMSVTIYGTSDGRTAEIINHKTWGATPALPTEYIYDPSLKPGERKQIDWAVGGIKSSFESVVKNAQGEIIRTERYNSNYRPWSAKYLVGTPVL
jgi:vancomycin resistance protein YoaR